MGQLKNLGRKHSGFALIVSLVILVLLTLLVVTGLRSSIVEETVSGNQKLAASALFGAEHGVSAALDELFAGTISDSGLETDPDWTRSGTSGGTGYTANYSVKHLVRGGTQIEDDDGRRYFVINSTGSTTNGDARRMLEVGIALEWGDSSNVAGFIGCRGVTGMSNVTTTSYSACYDAGTCTEAPDGNRGDIETTESGSFIYLDASSDMDITGEVRSTGALYMGGDALVGRDALANYKIKMMSNSYIGGSAYTNSTWSGSSSQSFHVGGSVYQNYHINPLVQSECDPLDINAIMSAASSIRTSNNNGSLGLASGAKYSGTPDTIPSGDYYFEAWTLDSAEDVTITGNVRLWIGGDEEDPGKGEFYMDSDARVSLNANASLEIFMDGGRFHLDSNTTFNNGGLPINVKVWSDAQDQPESGKDYTMDQNLNNEEPDYWIVGDASITLNSNNIFYGIIYAPLAHVYVSSNTKIYGSVRGAFVTADSNFGFSYDEDLDVLWTGAPTDYKLVYWTELYPED